MAERLKKSTEKIKGSRRKCVLPSLGRWRLRGCSLYKQENLPELKSPHPYKKIWVWSCLCLSPHLWEEGSGEYLISLLCLAYVQHWKICYFDLVRGTIIFSTYLPVSVEGIEASLDPFCILINFIRQMRQEKGIVWSHSFPPTTS